MKQRAESISLIREGIAVLRGGYRTVDWQSELTSGDDQDHAGVWPDYDDRVWSALMAASRILGPDPNYLATMSEVLEARVVDLDRDQLRTLVTAMLRGERFATGFTARFIEDGRLLEVLERVLQGIESGRGEGAQQ